MKRVTFNTSFTIEIDERSTKTFPALWSGEVEDDVAEAAAEAGVAEVHGKPKAKAATADSKPKAKAATADSKPKAKAATADSKPKAKAEVAQTDAPPA